MKTLHKLTSEEKLKYFGYGEWVEEPDEAYWEYRGIECIINRNCRIERGFFDFINNGHLCGYIKIPETNPFYNKEYEDLDLTCHGGITYESMESTGFWIGFDCAHACDLSPGDEIYNNKLKEMGIPFFKSRETQIYRNFAYVKTECESLVDQVLEAMVIK